ncbi:MAG: hypothetical protein IJR14_01875 [Synergistaceae bacterium]|nr:hypothetical protein [Synergistaceae bacterium]
MDVRTQEIIQSWGRSIRIDVLARDEDGTLYNIEIQRSDAGAEPRRARFHSALLDTKALGPGEGFGDLRDAYVIFITEHDVLGGGLPLYRIERRIEGMDRPFGDGSHIYYVNGSMQDPSTPLGALMHDFSCADPAEMIHAPLAERTKWLKESEEGRTKMGGMIEELRAEGRLEGHEEGRLDTLVSLVKDGLLSLSVAATHRKC